MKIRMLVADLDGTITEDRGSYRVPLEAVEAARRLQETGVLLGLVSANAVPVLAGVARYLDIRGPVIGETGCMAYYREELIHLCRESAREAAELVEKEFRGQLRPSWQNVYRHHDFAFRIVLGAEPQSLVARIRERLVEAGFESIHVGYSGFAIHLTPLGRGKAYGFREACRLAGINPSETAAIGDSDMDAPMLVLSGLPIAVSNADPGLRRVARIVTRRPSGYGFAEAVDLILGLNAKH